MRIFLYARVSTTAQEVENQLLELHRWAELLYPDASIAAYSDVGTGTNAQRLSFQEVLKFASQRKFDVLLFWSLDRLTREGVLETLHYLHQLAGWGVKFRSYQEPYLDSLGPWRDAVVGLLATVASFESSRRSERVKLGQQRARVKGTKSGRPIGRPTIRPELVAWIQAQATAGLSLNKIRAALPAFMLLHGYHLDANQKPVKPPSRSAIGAIVQKHQPPASPPQG